jgi:hypothetical protein
MTGEKRRGGSTFPGRICLILPRKAKRLEQHQQSNLIKQLQKMDIKQGYLLKSSV